MSNSTHKIIVTGGAGFIGSNLSNTLFNLGHKIYVIDDLSKGKEQYLQAGVDLIKTDVSSKKSINIIKKIGPDFIIHLAAQTNLTASWKNPEKDIRNNMFPLVPILDVARDIKVKNFLFSSSAAVFGETDKLPINESAQKQPTSIYGTNKIVSEYYIQYFSKRYNFPFIILRFANVYGKNQDTTAEGGVVAIFISQILRGQKPTIHGNGKFGR